MNVVVLVQLKGVILAAGKGTRLRPITLSIPKPLIPLLGKPLVTYGIDQMKLLGIRDYIMVVGWLSGLFKETLKDGSELGINLKYVTQEKRLGIAHAIHLAIVEGKINEPFLVYLGDNLLSDTWVDLFKNMIEGNEKYDVIVFLVEHPDPRRFGVAILKEGKLVGFVEKPKVPPSNLALTGLYYFRDPVEYEECFKTLKPSWRGEYEITDIINCYIKNSKKVGYLKIEGWWKDAGKPDDLLDALILVMDNKIKSQIVKGTVKGNVHGKVIVEEGAVVEGTVFGPAYIGKGAYIGKEAVLEHYVDVEGEARVLTGSMSRALILPDASLDLNDARLRDSIIGPSSQIYISKGIRSTMKLVISQESTVDLR